MSPSPMRRRRFLSLVLPLSLACVAPVVALRRAVGQPPADNVRPIPPPGIPVPDADRAELTGGLNELTKQIDALRADRGVKKELLRYLPDVVIFQNAVRYALTYNEFYRSNEIQTAKDLLKQGMERATALKAGDAPWTKQTGLVVLGYVSKIDDSVQPYGLVVPGSWSPADRSPHRLDFFFHGRGEQLTELSFLSDHERNAGEFTPPNGFVLHPYGRYCNANRFAGETDLFEALADLKTRYPIDDDRVVVRGFSMGGASCWQFATHHADRWAAAAPGAGFSETIGFLNLNRPGGPQLPWWEMKLLHWYDCTDYAVNLAQLPIVAYNGDMDGQKQAADRMEEAMKAEGLTLPRVIGPMTGHRYHPDSKKEINAFIDPVVAKGRDTLPRKIRFTTWTLRYNRMHWLTVTGLTHHWERARVDGELTDDTVTLTTQNVTRLEIAPPAGRKSVVIDGQKLSGLKFARDEKGMWKSDNGRAGNALRKRPGLQGPIDDAFLERFVMVRPTGSPMNAATGGWVDAEMKRAITAWRAQFRGDALVRDDSAVTKEDIRDANLVLWGDPRSNAVLAKIAGKLPITWDADGGLKVNGKTYPAGTAAPVLIFPNPLNPNRYVVLNSGITWRETAYLNNAQQRSRLPDWAVIDITVPANKDAPGRIADTGFFDESWKFGPPAQ